jgi:tRNA pseudouridine55 synthase
MASSHGLLIVDKPPGLTSRAVVDRVQRWFARGTRVGHAGTLDPLATGVLVLCVGNATRLVEYVQRMTKTYRAGVLLGARSDTDDADGTITPANVTRPPERAEVDAVLAGFLGEVEQVPPAYSAAKVQGRRAHDLARRGEALALQSRRVRIDAIEVHGYVYPRLDLEIRCGKGTYIRSLARDLGERLGCGGLIESLRRTSIGPFKAESALALEIDADSARRALLPLAAAVSELPRISLHEVELRRLQRGQAIRLTHLTVPAKAGEVAVFDQTGDLIVVSKVDWPHEAVRPVKVLQDEL